MKKTITVILIMACLTLFGFSAFASGTSGDTAFIPEMLTMAYNDSLKPVFTALSLDDSTVSTIEEYARVSFMKQEGDATVYANAAQTIFFFFGSTSRYSSADNIMFYTSLKDSNPLKNLPQQAFAFAICALDSSCDFRSFGGWVNDATDNDTYNAPDFFANYKLTPSDNSSIILIKT